MQKQERQSALLSLIRKQRVGSQVELASQLKRAGFAVTQASISRDLDELGIVKAHGIYTRPVMGRSEFGEVAFETAGGCMVVGRCRSGLASAVTVRIDSAQIPGIVGTIAGDDTIFIAVKSEKQQKRVLESLRALF